MRTLITSVLPRARRSGPSYDELQRKRLAKVRKRIGAKRFDAEVAAFHQHGR
jgi:hypothetical protein